MASASIAQVYGATLKTGEAVVLKVLRPNIKAAVEQDLNRIETMFNWINASWKDAYRLKLTQVLSDYRQVILAETSLTREADNAERLRDFWLPRGKLYVPLMYREYSSDSLLVMERVHGTIVTNLTTLKDNHVNLSKLSQLGVEIFFTQVFEDNFFHADMHPGNILVNHQDPENPTYIALDCAIIGQLTREDRNYLAKNLVAFFNEDYSAVASLHIESGWVPQSTSPTEMEAVIRQTCAPLFGKPMAEIEFGKLLVALFQAAQTFNMSIQPQLVLLQKTLLNIEGIGRQLHGELDLWQTAKPFLDQWMADRKSPSAHLERIKGLVPLLLTEGPELPEQIIKAPRRIEQILMANRQLEDRLTNLQAALARSRQTDRYRRYSMFLLGLSLLCFLPALTSEPGSLSVWRSALGSVAIIAALLIRGIRPK
jgi:ubiquinone biosynthesis protein